MVVMRKRGIIRMAYILTGALVFLALALSVELFFLPMRDVPLYGRLLFLLLLNLNVLALVGLLYFVGKSLFGIYREWRLRILGYRFKTKVMALFLILTAIPLGLLFLVSSGLGTNYIERFFTPQFRESIESSIEMVKSLYEVERRQVMMYAEAALAGEPPPRGYRLIRMKDPPENPSTAVLAAFDGKRESEVVTAGAGDIVRAAIPLGGGDGIMVLETTIPASVTENIKRVVTSYENYLNLEAWKSPLKLNYLLLLAFFTMIIIFSALWASLKIAGWITEPVKNLAAATEEVAAGNLSVSIGSGRRDEMGLLIDSFNNMVREMREDKESLQKAYLNMENIVRSIQSGVISLDEKGMVGQINAAACEILSVRAEEVLGKFYSALLEEIKSPELHELIKGINLKDFISVEREVGATVKGAKILLRVSITGLRGSTGEHLGILVVVDDLTDVIKAQRALAWQEVARRMTHEIKNPLTPIQLSTERMLKKWQTGDPDFDRTFERATKTIIREVDGLKRMVDEFSKMGKLPAIIREPTDVNAVIGDVVNLYRGYKHLEISVEGSGEVPVVELDGGQFKRAIINLIENAREAMDNRGRITVRLSPDSGANRIFISIEDGGPGIGEEDSDRLFQPYFSTKKDGTGLGLVITDKIIVEHGGSIRVRENSPRGCVFTIELPIKEV
jgi:two-component system nitrogen regulation sensor histidine kinase NtrY